MHNYPTSYNSSYYEPLPEECPKLLKQFSYFRVLISDEYKEAMDSELPVIPMTRDIKSKALKEYADNKVAIKNGELISFVRFDSRGYNQYIFATEDGLEIVLAEAFIKKKFLFPIYRENKKF